MLTKRKPFLLWHLGGMASGVLCLNVVLINLKFNAYDHQCDPVVQYNEYCQHMKRGVLIIYLLIIFGCSDKPKSIQKMELVGINGRALYAVVDGNVVMMSKPSLNNEVFKIHFNRDTLILGDTLSAIFTVKGDALKIEMDSPVSQTITDDRFDGGIFRYDFRTDQLGVKLFSGTFTNDSTSMPFELKFLVTR